MGRRQPNVECYYRELTCSGTSWTCRRCQEKFCSLTHWHISRSNEPNVVCAACEREETTQEIKPVELPARISITHSKDKKTAEIEDTATGQKVTVQREHMESVRKVLVTLFDETAMARWLYDQIANTDTGLDGYGLTVTDGDLLAETLAAPLGVEPDKISDDYGTSLT